MPKIIFFKNRIKVERTAGDSAQAVIFYGRDVKMDMRVVLKQYTGVNFNDIVREIKVFTELEKVR